MKKIVITSKYAILFIALVFAVSVGSASAQRQKINRAYESGGLKMEITLEYVERE